MKTKLEEFSEKVAGSALGIDVKSDTKAIDIATILMLVQAIAQIIAQFQNCPKPPAPATILNPSWIQKVQFRVIARNVLSEYADVKIRGLSAKVANACFAEASKMKEAEISLVLEETDALVNWLI